MRLIKQDSTFAFEELPGKGGSSSNNVWSSKDKSEMFTWDFAMVFKSGMSAHPSISTEYIRRKMREISWNPFIGMSPAQQKKAIKHSTAAIVKKIRSAGLNTCLYLSSDNLHVICLIGASEERLEMEAARVDYDLELNIEEVIRQGKNMRMRLCQSLDSTHPIDAKVNRESWYRLFGKYQPPDDGNEQRYRLYRRPRGEGPYHSGTLFRTVDRLKLTRSILMADQLVGGASISVYNQLEDSASSLIAFFPLHQADKREQLRDKWLVWDSIFHQPLDDVRNYFGEKIAMYFAFLGFYSRWLVVPSVVGLVFFTLQMAYGRIDIPGVALYAFFVALWSTFFLEFWKREESKHRVDWGMLHFEETEQPRPEFKGNILRSPVDGRLRKYFPLWKKILRMAFSGSVIFGLVCVVVLSVVGIFILRKFLTEWNSQFGSYLTAVINAVQIHILNYVYRRISVILNDYENHRTESQYENALIAKNFVFKFFNSFNSLFYIAFFKKNDTYVGGCVDNDCLSELQVQLAIIFGVHIIVNNVVEILVPLIQSYRHSSLFKKEEITSSIISGGGKARFPTRAEKEFYLQKYESTLDDFDELIVQFGYVTLFVIAFPLAPLLALVNNYFEIRLDAKKICSLSQRPLPSGSGDIGTWYAVVTLMSFASVLTNVGLVVFSTNIFGDIDVEASQSVKIWYFLVTEHIIIAIKMLIVYFISDVPASVRHHILRQDYVVGVLVNGMGEHFDNSIGSCFDLSKLARQETVFSDTLADEVVDWDDLPNAEPDYDHLWEFNNTEVNRRLKETPDDVKVDIRDLGKSFTYTGDVTTHVVDK